MEYLNNWKIQFSQLEINNKEKYKELIDILNFDGNVTDEQKSKLIDILNKTTNFFIEKALIKNKQIINPITN